MMKPREDFGLFEYQTNDGKELYGVRLRIKGRRKEWQGFQTLARGRPQSRHVNRRMAKLLRGFRLAAQQDPPLVTKEPPWQALDEAPPRSGFLEWNTFTQIRTAMRRHAQIPVTIAFWTGMRIGEILSLTWSQLTSSPMGRLQLTGLTKNGRPRQVIMPGDLYETLWDWRQQTRDIACPFVCQYAARRLGSIKRHWESVCVALKLATGEWVKEGRYWRNYEGPLVHDLRRTGLRNLIRAGVDRDTAKSITGHLTDSVFSRYNIIDEEDLAEAGEKVVRYIKDRSASTTSSTTSSTMAIRESA